MLRNLLLSLSIISLTSACAIRGNGHGLAYVADGTMVVAGVALLAKTEPEPIDWLGDASAGEVVGQSERWSHELGAAMLITGLVAAGVNLYLNIDEEKPDPRGAQAAAFAGADLPPLPAGPRANPEAVRMTQQARRLAIAGQCPAVRDVAARVPAADAIYYREVTAQDPPIHACL